MARNILIDQVRFVAIVLVILGHSIQYNSLVPFDNIFFRMIYSFHMPLFFFVSGFVSYNSIFIKNQDIKNKLTMLLYPFFIWSMILIFSKNGDFGLDVLWQLILNPSEGYWFLWVLFWIGLFVSWVVKVKSIFLKLLIILLILIMPAEILFISSIKYHSIYFVFGLLAFKYQNSIKIINLSNKYETMIVLIALLLSMFYLMDNNEYYKIIGYGILQKIIIYTLKITTALCMIFATFIFVAKCDNYLKSKYIVEIGAYFTLHLYVIHYFFINTITIDNAFFNVMINFMISSLISLTIIYFVKMVDKKGFSQYLFGRKI